MAANAEQLLKAALILIDGLLEGIRDAEFEYGIEGLEDIEEARDTLVRHAQEIGVLR
jgi:hypothetical protein